LCLLLSSLNTATMVSPPSSLSSLIPAAGVSPCFLPCCHLLLKCHCLISMLLLSLVIAAVSHCSLSLIAFVGVSCSCCCHLSSLPLVSLLASLLSSLSPAVSVSPHFLSCCCMLLHCCCLMTMPLLSLAAAVISHCILSLVIAAVISCVSCACCCHLLSLLLASLLASSLPSLVTFSGIFPHFLAVVYCHAVILCHFYHCIVTAAVSPCSLSLVVTAVNSCSCDSGLLLLLSVVAGLLL